MKTFLEFVYVATRYTVAFLVVVYGFAKLNGAQFNTLDSVLDRPLGQVGSAALTWYFFGYSAVYGTIIAMTQILGGVLLLFRRTTLLGACLLVPVIGNIILVDVFFQIHYSALVVAIFILACLLFLVGIHGRELLELFWSKQNSIFPRTGRPVFVLVTKALVCTLLLVVPYGMTYWAANYNNRRPTPIDGVWNLAEYSSELKASTLPSVIFFERNQARLAVFKYSEGKYVDHYFEVSPDLGTITIWEAWRRQGEKIFEGKYELSETKLKLQGQFAHQAGESTLLLTKQP